MRMLMLALLLTSYSGEALSWDRYELQVDRFEARYEIFEEVDLTIWCPSGQSTRPASIEYWHWDDRDPKTIVLSIDQRWAFSIDLVPEYGFIADSAEKAALFNSIVSALSAGSLLVVESTNNSPVEISLRGSASAMAGCRA